MPTVSVVLPVRNEAAIIEPVLAAVLSQEVQEGELEVIVVDGMSDDGTREKLRRIAAGDSRVRLLDNSGRIIPTALNMGIRAARAEVIMRVDGHAVLHPNYVRECLQTLQQHSTTKGMDQGKEFPVVVGGAWNCVGQGVLGEAIAVVTSSKFGIGNPVYRTTPSVEGAPIPADSVPFWLMRRQVFESVGLFREEMLSHEDYEMNHRIRAAGGKILVLPWVRADYYVRKTMGALSRQYLRYGFWKGRFLRSHPASLKLRHMIPPMFVAALFCTAAASFFTRAGALSLVVLAGLYLAFLLTATLVLTATRRPRSPATVFLLPAVLSAVHLCWGTGVWFGLVRGAVRGSPPRLDQPVLYPTGYAAHAGN